MEYVRTYKDGNSKITKMANTMYVCTYLMLMNVTQMTCYAKSLC